MSSYFFVALPSAYRGRSTRHARNTTTSLNGFIVPEANSELEQATRTLEEQHKKKELTVPEPTVSLHFCGYYTGDALFARVPWEHAFHTAVSKGCVSSGATHIRQRHSCCTPRMNYACVSYGAVSYKGFRCFDLSRH
jgi:hypothetical protein